MSGFLSFINSLPHPQIKGVIAVSCCERLTSYDRIDQANRLLMTPSLILVWSFVDPIHPQVTAAAAAY